MLHEIVLPETKPETEWVRGRALQKVSPTYDHARLQGLLFSALADWADAGRCGRVGTEWRFRIAPPGEIVRPLVPDVAYLSYEALAEDAPDDAVQVPIGAPTLAVEVLSPDDRPADVSHKIATYLAAGTSAVVVVNPKSRTVTTHDAAGSRTYWSGEVVTLDALPGFTLDIEAFFARLRR
ncbi:MAG TPA: Uma2 family endonuclease [Candidatus Sulfotelmatobacter sp.]|nr:Uma2 family endonuclease [Candidatus Sulfotelmatobacter sp.]